ncbi:50S ribosomal protein L22 [Candidatus Woesearchaeota archaeon]|nr:MAG: 50S ribosomal protein L22 [Candidatus Woesearchaeota archaeon]
MANEHTARVTGRDLPISRKHCVEIGNLIRKKPLSKAKNLLEGVMSKTVAVPMKKFNFDTGHKRGSVGPGRYPYKASMFILKLLGSIEKNAEHKGLNTESLVIKTFMANKGTSQWRYGRQRRRRAKRTNIIIEVEELYPKKEQPKAKDKNVSKPKEVKKEESKPEVKQDLSKSEDKQKKASKPNKEAKQDVSKSEVKKEESSKPKEVEQEETAKEAKK